MPASPSWSHYLPRSPVLRDSGLSCRGIGEHHGPRPRMAVRRLSTHAVLFVTSGRGEFTGLAGTVVPVVAPAVIWLFPGVAHRYDPTVVGWSEHWVLFEGIAARAYEALGAWQRHRPVHPGRPDLLAMISPVFADLRAGAATPGPRAELWAATQTHALIGIAAAQTGDDHHADGRVVRSATETVVATALEPGTVAERARAAGRSPDQLRREVAAETSLSVHELVVRTRVARAQQLLAGTDLSVGEIAGQVGYDDAAYFSRLFVARVGVAPTVFRSQAVR